jgi:hypothetical protein
LETAVIEGSRGTLGVLISPRSGCRQPSAITNPIVIQTPYPELVTLVEGTGTQEEIFILLALLLPGLLIAGIMFTNVCINLFSVSVG